MLAVPALALAGCSKAEQTNEVGSGDGVAVGASMEEYHEALAEMEPVNLTFQVQSANELSAAGQRDAAVAEAIEEWSAGKITVDIAYANAVVPPDEMADALADGRLDLAAWATSYFADEMKAFVDLQDALVSVKTSPLVGEIAMHFTAQEAAFESPEIMAEFEAQGMTALNPYISYGATVLACGEEKEALADFDGDQVRANAAAQDYQIGALGGSTVTLQLAETYEGLQRNVLQCTVGSPSAMVSYGWLETAGNVYVPSGSSFVSGPGSIVAGASWDTLPLAAQQLIFDRMFEYNSGELGATYVSQLDMIEQATEHGSGVHYLDEESEQAVSSGNDEILRAVRQSENLDGEALIASVEESEAKWIQTAEDLGYTDEGDYLDFPEWYEGNGKVMDPDYLDPVTQAFYDEVLAEHRPS